LAFYNETLPIINKPKHPKKGRNKEQNGRTHVQEDNKTTKEGKPQRNVKFSNPLVRSISNRERGGALKRMHSLKEPSPTAITRSKIKIACAHYNIIDPFYL